MSTSKPRVILGLMTCGPDEAVGARITDPSEFNTLLERFQSRGYKELDTARVYLRGNQEAFTKSAGWVEKGFALATKVKYPNAASDNNAQGVIESVETSLKELGTDHVDILYLHAADRTVPFTETLSALDQLHKRGKFTHLGLSNFTAFEVAEIVLTAKYHNWIRPTIYQAMYNALSRSIEPELIPACRRYGLDIVVYNPLAGGLLSGKVKDKDSVPSSGRFSGPPGTLGSMYRGRYFKDGNFAAVQIIEESAKAHGITAIEAALRWLVHHSALKTTKDGGNDGFIIGVSSVQQLESNLDYFEKGPLPDEVVKTLDEAWGMTRVEMGNYWHGEVKYAYDTREALFASEGK